MTTRTSQTTSTEDTTPKISFTALEFLLLELVPLAQRVTDQLHTRETALKDAQTRSRTLTAPPNTTQAPAVPPKDTASTTTASTAPPTSNKNKRKTSTAATEAPSSQMTTLGFPRITPNSLPTLASRLEQTGHRTAQALLESLTVSKPRPNTPLEAIKFICKDLWPHTFRKQIDNLKTNHRGVFVLTDNRYQALARMSVDRRAGVRAGEESLERGMVYLYFPCGLIRGALASLGIEATVEATCAEIPVATFHIKTKGSKP